jgi:predicted ATPase/class 3 adenylate cyclase
MSVIRGVELPAGVVTLLFSDMEGSTRLLHELGDAYGELLAEHHQLLSEAWSGHGGVEFGTEGDACFVAFPDPSAAVTAAAEAQRLLAAHRWSHGGTVRVRIGVHTGTPKIRDGDYWGIDVHYAARLCAAASGGQVLLSRSTAALIDVEAQDLGEHALKDFPAARRLFHLPVDGRGSDQFPPPRTLRAGRTNLPAMLSSHIGRERQLAEVSALLEQVRMLTLVGAGGVGKTRLALAAGAQMLDGSGDGVWLVGLAPLTDSELVAREVARALGVSEQPGRPTIESLIDSVGQARLLLVLDNCEHVVGAVAELVGALLPRCAGVVVLATSRERLGVPGERLYPVPSLSLPAAGETDKSLERSEAVQLFVERAREHRPGFAVDERNAAAIAAVVRRLDGIPLALELAAARLRSLSIDDLHVRLQQSFRLLSAGSRAAIGRQQTMAALIDWSYALLSDAERVVLNRLSVFAGGFDLAAAERVCAVEGIDDLEVVDLLTALVDKSLVGVDDLGERLRYRLLETVRAYASDKLAPEGADVPAAVRRAHRDHYLQLAQTAHLQLGGADQGVWLDQLEVDNDNLRVALSYSLEDSEAEPGLRLAAALLRFWSYRGHALEGARAITAQLQRPRAGALTLVRARALIAAGHLLSIYVGEQTAAEGYAEEALLIARSVRDDHAEAAALGVIACVRMRQGRHDEAREISAAAVVAGRAGGDPLLLATLLRWDGSAVMFAGGDGRASLHESLVLYRAAGDRTGVSRALHDLGCAELSAGNIGGAVGYLEESLAIDAQLDTKDNTLSTWLNLGLAAYLSGDRRRARELYVDALRVARDTETTAVPYALSGLALTMSPTEPERAARLHGTVDRLLQDLEMHLEPMESAHRDEDLRRLRAALGDVGFEHERQAGRACRLRDVIVDVLGREYGRLE